MLERSEASRSSGNTRFLLIASYSDSLVNFRGPLLSDLVQHGFEVHVAAPGLLERASVMEWLGSRGIIAHDIPLQRTGLNPVADIATLRGLWQLMRKIRPEFVLPYTIKPVIYGLLAARLASVPHRFALITGLGYAFQDEGGSALVRSVAHGLYRAALLFAEKVFFQNHDDEELFRATAILSASVPSCVVNGSGVDLEWFTCREQIDQPLRFLLIARLLAGKGVREYVAAARQVRLRFPGAVFELIGPLDSNPDSISMNELDGWIAEGVVEYGGELADVRPAIERCNVYVLPSNYREGTPRTVLEAMAMGRPIITTDAPGCRQTVVEGYNGFLVPKRSVDGLAHAMMKFLNEPGLMVAMGQNARTLAEERYEVHKINAVMIREMGAV